MSTRLPLRSSSFMRMKAMEAPEPMLVRQSRVLSACRAAGCNRGGAMTNHGAGATLAVFGHQQEGPVVSQDLVLYSYWRSTAAYRVRIALNLKQLSYETRPVHLVRDGGQQHAEAYRRLNPQELVPTLLHDKHALRQSLAIMEYLDEMWPEPPLLPSTPRDRARVRALADVVACDIHPIGNLRVLQYLGRE